MICYQFSVNFNWQQHTRVYLTGWHEGKFFARHKCVATNLPMITEYTFNFGSNLL